MPELPDVQVFKEYMDATSLHQPIQRASLRDADLLARTAPSTLRRRLRGREFEGTYRHGKHLFAALSDDGWLRLHFGMTGFLQYYKDDDRGPGHVRLRIDFANGYHLAYDCQRKFGELEIIDDVKAYIEGRELGPDPFRADFDLDRFREALSGRRGAVKSALMNQSVLAGIGNVYSDEILFHAGVYPGAAVDGMKSDTIRKIYRAMERVLRKAVECRVDPACFPRSWLVPRRGATDECPKCGGQLRSEKISGRTAHYCARHQRRRH